MYFLGNTAGQGRAEQGSESSQKNDWHMQKMAFQISGTRLNYSLGDVGTTGSSFQKKKVRTSPYNMHISSSSLLALPQAT